VVTHKAGKSGARKYGRNEVKCKRYKSEHKLEKNKLRKLIKLARKQPNNKQLFKKIKELQNVIN